MSFPLRYGLFNFILKGSPEMDEWAYGFKGKDLVGPGIPDASCFCELSVLSTSGVLWSSEVLWASSLECLPH